MERIDPTAFDLSGIEEQKQIQKDTWDIIERTKNIGLDPGRTFPIAEIHFDDSDHYWKVPKECEVAFKGVLQVIRSGR